MAFARSKAPLALVELVLMILVFAFCAAVSVWAFAWSDTTAKGTVTQDDACVVVESVAETVRAEGADGRGASHVLASVAEGLGVGYEPADGVVSFETASGVTVVAAIDDDTPAGTARVEVSCEETGMSVPVVWQVSR